MGKIIGKIEKNKDSDAVSDMSKTALDQLFPGYHCAECGKYFELKFGMMVGSYVYKKTFKGKNLMYCSYGCYHKSETRANAAKSRLCS